MTQVTPSVTTRNPKCQLNYSNLINLRNGTTIDTPHILTTTIVGRNTGNNIKFLSPSEGINATYDDFKMRRKAETLKYRHGISATAYTRTASDNFSNVVKTGGSSQYSSTRLSQLIRDNQGVFPDTCKPGYKNVLVKSSPSSSGIRGSNSNSGYLFLNPYVAYYPTI